MLDVITVISESTPRSYVLQCQRSIEAAAKLASYPINIIESPGIPGHIGRAMHRSLKHARNPYVCWVDDDDFVLPNAFSCLREHYPQLPSAIYARELRVFPGNGHMEANPNRHHLCVWHRDVIDQHTLTLEPARPYHGLADIAESDCVDELAWVYVHRVYNSAGQKLRGLHR